MRAHHDLVLRFLADQALWCRVHASPVEKKARLSILGD